MRDAKRLVAEIQTRDKLPLLVGGTMLDVKALCEGVSELRTGTPQRPAALDAEAIALG